MWRKTKYIIKEEPKSEKPILENPTQLNTKETNKKESYINEINNSSNPIP